MKRILIFLSPVLIATSPLCAAVCNPGGAEAQLRVDHYMTDALLHRRWAVMVDCSHPDRPWTLKAEPWPGRRRAATSPTESLRKSVTSTPLVHAGGKVQIWHVSDGARIELTGTSLETGYVGQMIHVRTGKRGVVLSGKVRGAGSVELSGSGKWKDLWQAQ
jgi:hypothetical protein